MDLDIDWSLMGWDATREGEMSVCVYDVTDYDNSDCSEFSPFTGSTGGFAGTDQTEDAEGDQRERERVNGYSSDEYARAGGGLSRREDAVQ